MLKGLLGVVNGYTNCNFYNNYNSYNPSPTNHLTVYLYNCRPMFPSLSMPSIITR